MKNKKAVDEMFKGTVAVKYPSISAEVKNLILEVVADGQEHERREIVGYIREHIQDKESLTDGIVAGGFKMLTASGEIKVTARAVYQKGVRVENQPFRERVMAVFTRFQQDLNRACTVNLLYASKEDMEFICSITELSNLIEGEIWRIEEMYQDSKDDKPVEMPPVAESEKEEAVKEVKKV